MFHGPIANAVDRRAAALTPRAERVLLQLAARIRTPQGWQDARICNAGPGGLMLRCSLPPQPGTRVVVRCGTTRLRGVVRWADMGKCGIASMAPLDVAGLRCGRMVLCRQSWKSRLLKRVRSELGRTGFGGLTRG